MSLPVEAEHPAHNLEVWNVSKAFPGVKALDNVSFDCVRGEVHALVGENGAGKSTLLKILCGAYRPDSGKLVVNGGEVSFGHPQEAQAAGISVIYQEFNLLPDRTIAENIFLGRELMRGPFIDSSEMIRRTKTLLAELEVPLNPRVMVGGLRVAQQQIVEIAKALSLNASIMLMDEPTAALSLQEVDNLMALVRRLKARGITILYISHRLDEVFAIADRVTILKDGHWIATRPIANVTHRDLVSLMVGRELDEYFPPKAETIGETLLSVKHLSVGDFLKDINFELRRGEILGIAGLEGSGRTLLARALFGAEWIRSGTITLNGKPIVPRSPHGAIDAGIGFISDDRKREGLALGLSIRANIALPSLDRRQRLGWIAQGLERKTIAELSRSLEIRAANEKVETQYLSGGNQQKVVLAKWLATDAKLVIFNEPTRGIDIGAKASIHKLMRDLATRGVGVIMISSELPEVLGMSDRILVMQSGTLVSEFSGPDITEEQVIHAATGAVAAQPIGVNA